MRISKLLVSGALLFGFSGVHAAVVDGVRQKPVPQKTTFQYGEAFYLYNVGTKQYYCGANDWSTRASVSDEGWQVKIAKFIGEGESEWDGKTVILTDSVLQGSFKGKWLKGWFTTSKDATSSANYLDGGLYTDWNNQVDTLWTINLLENDIVRLGASERNDDYLADSVKVNPSFVGVDQALDNGTNTRLWAFLDPSVATNCVDWYAVSLDEYTANQEAIKVYDVAQELYALLTEAKGKGVDVTAWEAIYVNENATTDELKTAMAEVKTAIQKADETNVDVNNPIDKTNLITNPDYASAANTGWSGTTPAFGYGAAEFYNKTYNAYQKIGEASNGVYALSLNAFYRAGSVAASYENFNNGTNDLAQLYAVAGEDTLTTSIMNIFQDARDSKLGTGTERNEKGADSSEGVAFVPNNMQAASAYFEEGRYKDNIVFFGVDDNQFTIGLSKTTTLDTDWTLFDNWKLTYYGNSPAAFQKWQAQVLADAYDATIIPEGTKMTNGAVDAYNAVKNGLSTPSTKAEVMANIKTLSEAADALKANIAAWAAYNAAVEAAQATIDDPDIAEGDLKTALDDLVYESDDDFEDLTLTTEEVIAKTEKLVAANDNCIKNSIKVGSDVTDKFLVNARYEEGTKGWNGSPTVNGPKDNKCAEKYNTAFDVYQEVKDAPVGVYSISLQGFYRPGDNSVAWPIYKANDFKWTKSTSICVYVNNNSNPLKNIYDEEVKKGELFQTTDLVGPAPFEAEKDEVTQDSVWFVNDMTNAGIAFSNGMYTSTAFGLVAKAGDVLRIGIKGELDNTNQWICWDNFKMVFQGTKADIIKPELEKAIASAKVFLKEDGKTPVSNMSKTAYDELTAALSAGNEAVGGEDGKAMFAALSALYESIESANASIKACEELVELAETMNNLAMSSDCPASEADKTKAIGLYTDIMGGIEETSLTDEQIADYITKVKEMTVTLKIPAGEATDENPQDLTSLIATPGFEDAEGNNSTAGWTGATGSFGNNDTQKAALLYEYYEKTGVDMYQDIVGLPNGTYEVSASAFCRLGGAAADAEAYTANPDTLSNALLYAVSADNEMNAVGIKPISAGALEESIGSGSESDVTINGVSMKVPNDMVSANAYFQIGKYVNTVTVKVTDKTLRIGLRKDTKVGSDWLIIDNFKLTYFGENSEKKPSGDPTGIETIGNNTAKVAKVEYYGVNGVRNATLVKGINIMKTTMADGTVVVNKVMVK